jgi:hypothetical protein
MLQRFICADNKSKYLQYVKENKGRNIFRLFESQDSGAYAENNQPDEELNDIPEKV